MAEPEGGRMPLSIEQEEALVSTLSPTTALALAKQSHEYRRRIAELETRIEQLEKENARLVENWNILGEKVNEGLPHIRAIFAVLGSTIHEERCLGERLGEHLKKEEEA